VDVDIGRDRSGAIRPFAPVGIDHYFPSVFSAIWVEDDLGIVYSLFALCAITIVAVSSIFQRVRKAPMDFSAFRL
jgi:hypothetical protein